MRHAHVVRLASHQLAEREMPLGIGRHAAAKAVAPRAPLRFAHIDANPIGQLLVGQRLACQVQQPARRARHRRQHDLPFFRILIDPGDSGELFVGRTRV